ncbi:histidine phosphatase family protein [Billgrantia kenyensis]|uniref:Histidine phosphatase family protein n=1 Tax=Billgrantia kenyensis TaxID=321266 RepID=A0A7V9W2H8_9GAMM|nr:histidine phosphatase family protein [Halomonas kenyensis]MBA2779810.1 histidine phosphatase family protein [Halomonas kenyensis]MCG6662211.1 histidine phosphatase family protein [Halomonas kenyensis]
MSNSFQASSRQRHNRYLLMRHGHSQANARGLIISTPQRGLAEFGLSPEGEQQLASLLQAWRWPAPTRILHSDFLRTRETARRVAAHFGLELQPEPRLRERSFGDFEGLADRHYEEVWKHDEHDPAHRAFGVESVTSVAARMQAVIASLEQEMRHETILLVSHGDPLQIMLTAIEDQPLTRHRARTPLLPASITMLD